MSENDTLNPEIQEMKSAIQKLKKENRRLWDEIKKLKKSLQPVQVQEKISSLAERILDLNEENKKIETAKQQAEQKANELKVQLGTAEQEIVNLKNQLKSAKNETETAKSQADREIADLKNQMESAKNETEIVKSQADQEIADLKIEKSHAEEKIKALTENVDLFKLTLDEYENNTARYIKLMKAIYPCRSMQKYLSDKGLPESFSQSPKTIITFISVAGAGYILASDIIRYIGQYKQNQHEPITQEEKVLIDTVNLFYQEKYNLPETECVLYIPKGMETFSDFKIPFKKQEMQDINKAIGSFQYAVALYVPAYHEPNSTFFKAKAIVEGK